MSRIAKIHLIVEGQGDAQAVPLLVRRLLAEHGLHHVQTTSPQISGGLDKARKRFVDYLRYGLKNECPILWVLDCDDKVDGQHGCPVAHARDLHNLVAQLSLETMPAIEFALFSREFESLFLAEQQALKSYYGLAPDKAIPEGASRRRDAKGEISRLLPKSSAYKETVDQAKLASRLYLAICRDVSRDFVHFESALLRLCADG